MGIVFKLAARIPNGHEAGNSKNVILLSVQSYLSIFNQNNLHKCNDTYRVDANTTALLIRAACGNFLNKSPLFVANI